MTGITVTFNKEARQKYLQFAMSAEADWSANFRDLGASVTRMATLAPVGRINETLVLEETSRLKATWRKTTPDADCDLLVGLFGSKRPERRGPF